jgi:hypothetical protein
LCGGLCGLLFDKTLRYWVDVWTRTDVDVSETQDLTINYDFIKNVSSSTDINEAASILQKIIFDIFIFCSGLVTEVYEHSFYDV